MKAEDVRKTSGSGPGFTEDAQHRTTSDIDEIERGFCDHAAERQRQHRALRRQYLIDSAFQTAVAALALITS